MRERGRGPLGAQADLDAAHPGFATVVDLSEDAGERPADALAEAIARAPGVHVRSLGGLGHFSAVSLRGSSPQQVAIFLDGVPLGSSMAGLVDLSRLPADTLAQVRVYRGFVPIALGGAAVGGALDLRGAPGERRSLTLDGGLGSYGARQARVAWVRPLRRRGPVLSLRLGYAGADGDFPFLDTGTPRDPADDRTSRRLNNDYDRVLAQVRLDGRRGATRGWVQLLAGLHGRGIPGPAGAQWVGTRETTQTLHTLAGLRHLLPRAGSYVAWRGALELSGRRFHDPDGAVGVGRNDQVSRTVDAYLSPRLRLSLWRGAFLTTTADLRAEWIAVDERARPEPAGDATRSRLQAGAGAELAQFLWRGRVALVPAYRVDALVSRFAVPAGAGEQGDRGRDDATFGHAPRVAARLRLTPGLSLRASAGRYFRPPTLVELFGDRGFAVGNEGLRPERGTSLDGGVVLDTRASRHLAMHATAAGFWTRSEDLIQWVNAGFVARPENVPGADLAGAEAGFALDLAGGDVRTSGSYTFLHTSNRDRDPTRRGQPLPGRPRHDLYARVALAHGFHPQGVPLRPHLAYDLEIVARTYLDLSGRLALPARVFHGLALGLEVDRRFDLTVSVRNLLDQRVTTWRPPVANVDRRLRVPISDVLGFPLPGRSLWVSLRVTLPEAKGARPT